MSAELLTPLRPALERVDRCVRLDALRPGQSAVVARLEEHQEDDPVAARLEELGFVPGEPLSVVALGPLGQDPMLVQIGYTRFALRRTEAQRVVVELQHG
jgi:ferrous iron transport protein A